MEVWIIKDGEKVGPIHDFEIRRKITDGELPETTPAWHEGIGEWKPLIEIDLFRREFENVSPSAEIALPEIETTPQETGKSPPPLPTQPVLIRRFWARWLDLTLYSAIWWLGMWAVGQDIGAALVNPWIMFFHYMPWFALEAVLIQHFATTPGKWLLGMRVVNLDGSHLDLSASTRRCMRVLFTGIGFGFSYLAVFCQILSLVVSKRIGTTVWDHAGGHQVIANPVQPIRVVVVVLGFLAAMTLQFMVVLPYMIKDAGDQNPKLKEYFEKHPPWSLPRRN